MKKTLLAGIAALSVLCASAAHAAEIPATILSQDWCLSNDSPDAKISEIFLPISGCKSLVFKRDAVIWNKLGEQASCTITGIENEGPEILVIKGHCLSRNSGAYALYLRLY